MSIEAMKQALEALESFREISDFTPAQAVHAITALRAAIAEAETQEPTAWYTDDHLTDRSATTYSKDMVYRWQCKGWPVTPLYTAPPAAQRQPLTDEQIRSMCKQAWVFETVRQWVRAIEQAHGIKEQA